MRTASKLVSVMGFVVLSAVVLTALATLFPTTSQTAYAAAEGAKRNAGGLNQLNKRVSQLEDVVAGLVVDSAESAALFNAINFSIHDLQQDVLTLQMQVLDLDARVSALEPAPIP